MRKRTFDSILACSVRVDLRFCRAVEGRNHAFRGEGFLRKSGYHYETTFFGTLCSIRKKQGVSLKEVKVWFEGSLFLSRDEPMYICRLQKMAVEKGSLSVIFEWERKFRKGPQKRQDFMVSGVSLLEGRVGRREEQTSYLMTFVFLLYMRHSHFLSVIYQNAYMCT